MTNTQIPMKSRIWQVPAEYSVTGGRDQGKQLRELILSDIHTCPPDGVLIVDFSAVRTFDFSAADEVVGGLIGRVISGDLGNRRFVLTELKESARESVEAVLRLRKRQCLELQPDGSLRVLGPLSSAHEETLQFVFEQGEVAVSDVAVRFGPNLRMPAATNRLNTLADAGLVVRRLERGGPRSNRFVYAAIVSNERRPEADVDQSQLKSTKGDQTA